MLLSRKTRRLLQTTRIVTGLVVTGFVVAIWTVPGVLNSFWVMAAFSALGLPGAVATFMVKADKERRTTGS